MGYKTYTCPVGKKCGACEWLAVPYPIQLERKREGLQELFKDFDVKVEPVLGMEEPVQYRNKIMAPFVRGPKGQVRFGMYERGTHNIIPCDECLVEHPLGRPILKTIAGLMRKFRIEPYDEDTCRGLLRHVILRIAQSTDEVMVTIVINRKEFPRKKAFVRTLMDRHPEISTVVFNLNTRNTNAVLGPVDSVAYGQGWLEDKLCGCTFRIPSMAFYQTNPQQTEVLYNTAIKLARLQPGERVLDAYCGIGTIGIIAAKQTKAQLIGIESVEDAAKIARENARINHVKNATFIAGDATEVLCQSVADGAFEDAAPDVVFMDPPRAGATEEFLQSVLVANPRAIVYVSCNPATQVRDIAFLGDAYRIKRIVPVDMFPHTKHVETVVLMSRGGSKL